MASSVNTGLHVSSLNIQNEYILHVIAEPTSKDPIQRAIASVSESNLETKAYHTAAMKFVDGEWKVLNTGLLFDEENGQAQSEIITLDEFKTKYRDSAQILAHKAELKDEVFINHQPVEYGLADALLIGLRNREDLPISFISLLANYVEKQNIDSFWIKSGIFALRTIESFMGFNRFTYGDFLDINWLKSLTLRFDHLIEGVISQSEGINLPGEYCTELIINSLEDDSEIKKHLTEDANTVTPTELLELSQYLNEKTSKSVE